MGQKGICVKIDDVFYKSLTCAGKVIGVTHTIIKKRCLFDKFPNYKIVPFRITYTKKECTKCGAEKTLGNFHKKASSKDGLKTQCKECCSSWGKGHYKNSGYYEKYNSQPEVKTKRNKRLRDKRKTDIAFKINGNMANGIRISLKGLKHGAHWETLVDYDLEKLMIHLESKFTEGMSWDNYGFGKYKWNIDHIIAKVKFNITSHECQGFKDCWALDNLQPLWHIRNIEKSDKPMEPKYLIKPF